VAELRRPAVRDDAEKHVPLAVQVKFFFGVRSSTTEEEAIYRNDNDTIEK
jgi:hypothetical protein